MDVVSFILALVPIVWLTGALLVLKWPAWKAAIGSFVLACVLAFVRWRMPADQVATASLEGFLMALWPIVLVIIAAVFTYNLCVRTGAMDVIGQMITSISSDRRILALLIAWCFGGFMEGMAGFGTAVAIPAGMLAALGFSPIPAVLLCLLANGVPTPYGSIGIPTVSLSSLVGLDASQLATTQMLQLAPFFLVVPFLIVFIASGPCVKGASEHTLSLAERFRGTVGICLVSGVSFVLPALVVDMFVGPELSMVVGSVCSLALTALLALRQKSADARFALTVEAEGKLTLKRCLVSWSCFILIFVLLLGTSKLVAPLNAFLARFATTVTVFNGPNPGTLTFTWINTPGVWILIAAVVGGFIQGATPKVMGEVFVATVKQMMPTVITMLSVLGCAKVMGYSGMISSISSFCIAACGAFFPLVAPWIGMIGTFVTGSGTSSGMLFGPVQLEAANALATDPYWLVALNSLGVAAGKMLSPQTLAIGLAAVQVQGKDSELLKAVLPYALVFLIFMSIIGFAFA